MRLVIDIGNTRVKAAVYAPNGGTHAILTAPKWSLQLVQRWYLQYDIYSCLLSSVRRHTHDEALQWLHRQSQFWELTHHTPLPIVNAYQTPHTLGKDRIAAAVGAWSKNEGAHSLVVDAGTCATYEYVVAPGRYLGGYITPGLQMRLQAMHHFTAQLPLLSKQRLSEGVGSTTADAMQGGAQRGLAHEIRGFYHDFCRTHGKARLLLCGGDANTLSPLLADTPHQVDHELVLQGLYKILLYNESISHS